MRFVTSLTLRRGTGRRFRLALDPRERWFRRVGTVLRWLVSPRRRRSAGSGGGGGGGGIVGRVVGGRRSAPGTAVAADLALKVQAHLHLHHLG